MFIVTEYAALNKLLYTHGNCRCLSWYSKQIRYMVQMVCHAEMYFILMSCQFYIKCWHDFIILCANFILMMTKLATKPGHFVQKIIQYITREGVCLL